MTKTRVLPCPADAARRSLNCAAFSAFFILLALWVLAGPAAGMEKRCAKAQAVVGMVKSLPALGQKIFSGEPIRIVALGSSSTEGTPDMPREQIFVSVLGRELAKQVMTPIEILNKGKGGETIAKMVDRLQRDVLSHKPDLLVWQLGVNDVLQMDGVDGAVTRMKAALEELRLADVPVVLVDLQTSPLVDRDKDTPAMQEAIEDAGKKQGVIHFHRQAFMKRMIETREATQTDLVQPDGLHMTQLGHFCTGQLLATQIAQASLMKQFSTVDSVNVRR
jgi:acyl-CoA thioesterase-1